MSIFGFVLVNGEKQFPLGDGVELLNVDEAIKHGQQAVQKVFRDQKLFDWFGWHLSIRAENGEEVAKIPVPDAAIDSNPAPRRRS